MFSSNTSQFSEAETSQLYWYITHFFWTQSSHGYTCINHVTIMKKIYKRLILSQWFALELESNKVHSGYNCLQIKHVFQKMTNIEFVIVLAESPFVWKIRLRNPYFVRDMKTIHVHLDKLPLGKSMMRKISIISHYRIIFLEFLGLLRSYKYIIL